MGNIAGKDKTSLAKEEYGVGGTKSTDVAASPVENTYRILFYGSGEGGKTSLVKQVRRIGGKMMLPHERFSIRSNIISNIFESTVEVLRLREQEFTDEITQQYKAEIVRMFEALGMNMIPAPSTLDDSLTKKLLHVYDDDEFQTEMVRCDQLQDTWKYFMEKLRTYPEFAGENWIPSDEEIMRVRERTVGVPREAQFVHNGSRFLTFDIGGQEHERHRYLALLPHLDAIIFVVAMSEYDQKMFENRSKRRIEDTFTLWRKTVSDDRYKNTYFAIYFNKFDVFHRKYRIENKPFSFFIQNFKRAPVATQDNDACNLAIDWYSALFLRVVPEDKKNDIEFKVLTALNQDEVRTCLIRTVDTITARKRLV